MFLQLLRQSENDLTKDIRRLLLIGYTLFVASASAERTFSLLKLVKTRLSNRMKDDLLDAIILILDATSHELNDDHFLNEVMDEWTRLIRESNTNEDDIATVPPAPQEA